MVIYFEMKKGHFLQRGIEKDLEEEGEEEDHDGAGEGRKRGRGEVD